MRYGVWKKGWALAPLVAALLAGAAAGQAPDGGVSGAEAAEARAVALAFAERLDATHDFAAVVRELYVEDFMSRQLKAGSGRAARAGSATFMLGGVPSFTFERSLAAEADVAEWARLRVASDNVLHLIFASLLSGRSIEEIGDPDKFNARTILDVFPPQALRTLRAHPALASFLGKDGAEVVIRTPAELRALASALEEVVRLTRPRFAELPSKGRQMEANRRVLGEAAARSGVEAAADEAVEAGYPEGTRLFRVFAPNGYDLLLLKQGGAMKVVRAGPPSD